MNAFANQAQTKASSLRVMFHSIAPGYWWFCTVRRPSHSKSKVNQSLFAVYHNRVADDCPISGEPGSISPQLAHLRRVAEPIVVLSETTLCFSDNAVSAWHPVLAGRIIYQRPRRTKGEAAQKGVGKFVAKFGKTGWKVCILGVEVMRGRWECVNID